MNDDDLAPILDATMNDPAGRCSARGPQDRHRRR